MTTKGSRSVLRGMCEGLSLDPPRAGNAAIRAALKEVLIGAGLWPTPRVAEDE